MKRTLALVVLLVCAPYARANMNPFSSFEANATQASLKPFALDLGGLLGSDSVQTGRTIGFPGFWVGGLAATQQRPDKNDLILRDGGVTAFGLPMAEVGVGLPFSTDVIVHGVSLDGARIYGGGVRTSLYRTDLLTTFLPNVSVAAFGDKVNNTAFAASHGDVDAAATWNLPILKPFFVAGYDLTKVTAAQTSIPGVNGESATAKGSRFSAGLDITPFPFTSVRVAYTVRHGISGLDLGLGITF